MWESQTVTMRPVLTELSGQWSKHTHCNTGMEDGQCRREGWIPGWDYDLTWAWHWEI